MVLYIVYSFVRRRQEFAPDGGVESLEGWSAYQTMIECRDEGSGLWGR